MSRGPGGRGVAREARGCAASGTRRVRASGARRGACTALAAFRMPRFTPAGLVQSNGTRAARSCKSCNAKLPPSPCAALANQATATNQEPGESVAVHQRLCKLARLNSPLPAVVTRCFLCCESAANIHCVQCERAAQRGAASLLHVGTPPLTISPTAGDAGISRRRRSATNKLSRKLQVGGPGPLAAGLLAGRAPSAPCPRSGLSKGRRRGGPGQDPSRGRAPRHLNNGPAGAAAPAAPPERAAPGAGQGLDRRAPRSAAEAAPVDVESVTRG